MCFLMAGPPRGDILLSGQDTIGVPKPWHLSQKVVLRATASHETDLSSKLRSRCGAAPIFGIPWPAQHAVRLPCVCRGGRIALLL